MKQRTKMVKETMFVLYVKKMGRILHFSLDK